MTRLTDEQVAVLEAEAESGEAPIVLTREELRALLDERRVLTQANAVLRAERDEALAAMPAEHADLALHYDALTRRCARLREAFHCAAVALHVHGNHRALWLDCTTPLCVDARALAADEKEG